MKNVFGKVFVLIISVMCVAVCVLLASLISSAITVSGATSSQTYSSFTVYGISLGSYATSSGADAICEDVMQKGGAGYVYGKDGVYHVLASAYERENDAKLVKDNLGATYPLCSIVEIEIPEPDFSRVSSQQQSKSFLSALSEIKNSFIKLYDISVSLDTKALDETKAKIQIIEVKSNLDKAFEEVSRGSTSIDGIYYQTIKNTFSNLESELTDLRNYESLGGISLSAKTKYAYINFLFELKDLVGLLNNEF